MDREQAKDKVAKLMAMATDGRGNEFEAEAALRQAEKLMRQHDIDVATLHERTGEKPVYKWATVLVPARPKRPIATAPFWFGILITAIGRFTDCRVSYDRTAEHGICAKFSGDVTDVEYAVWLCKNLRDDARRQSQFHAGRRSERDSFRKAYAIRIGDRMRALLAERRAALQAHAGTGTALVLVDRKIALRDAEFGPQTYGRAKPVRLHDAAASAGRSAADKAQLNRPLAGTKNRPLLN